MTLTEIFNNDGEDFSSKHVKQFFKAAEEASHFSDWPKQKLGAVIVYKNRILSVGWNTTKETSMQKKFNRFRNFDPERYPNNTHAEMNAIYRLKKEYNLKKIDMKKVAVFVYRETKDGNIGLAKPCAACEAAMRSIGITQVFYTTENSIICEKFSKKKKS